MSDASAAATTWAPGRMPTRHAQNTEGIHRILAIFYGPIGALIAVVALLAGNSHPGFGLAAPVAPDLRDL